MGVTTRGAIPYPDAADPDMPRLDIQALAEHLADIIAIDDQGPVAGRPVSTPESPGVVGRYYYATDQKLLFRDFGTGWLVLEPRTGVVYEVQPGLLDGQKMIISHDASEGEQTWEFVMKGGSGLWHCIGGPSVLMHGSSASSTPYTSTNWATDPNSPIMPIRWPGKYRVRAEYRALAVGVAQFAHISFLINKIGADDSDYNSRADLGWVGTSGQVTVILEDEFDFDDDVLDIRIAAKNGSAGNTVNIVRPLIELTPLTLVPPE